MRARARHTGGEIRERKRERERERGERAVISLLKTYFYRPAFM